MIHRKNNVLFERIKVITSLPDAASADLLDIEEVDRLNSSDKLQAVINDAYVSVVGGKFAYVGKDRVKAVNIFDNSKYDIYNGRDLVLWPSMANTHGHIPMTLMRNQTDDHNLHDWLFNVVFPMEARLTPEHVYHGTVLGLAEMIRSGTGAAADMYYHSNSVAQAALEAGFRLNVCCDGKKEGADGKNHVVPEEVSAFQRHWQENFGDLIKTSLLVHSVYLYEPYLYRELAQQTSDLGISVQVHISETQKEVDDCIAKYGRRPPAQLDDFGLLSDSTIAAHCVFLDDDDRALLARRGVTVAHNPSSNFKLGSGFADINAMIKAGIRISLGTDGAASNNNLNLYQEMRLAGFLAKGLTKDASCLTAPQLIRMATYNGMRGLGFDNTGCILPGWTADLQIVDTNNVAMTPLGNIDAALVYSADSNYVESLMVDGVWLMYKKELKTIDEEYAIAEANKFSASLRA
jgi:5-methylthioadenosine/S-adenosylhomocysteine deaminase